MKNKKILLHICCAPCSIYPIDFLQKEGFEVYGFFYKSNIHPLSEMKQREDTLKEYAESIGLKVIYEKKYDIKGFFQDVVFREAKRCKICYYKRLRAAAKVAKKGKFDFFSSTLLYSKFQNHNIIKELGASIAKEVKTNFYYNDFRTGWKEGIEKSKELNMYRQRYCGCLYSEKEAFKGSI